MQLIKVFQVVRSLYIYLFFFFFLHRFCRALKIIAGAILLAIVLVLTFYAVIFLLFNMA